VRFFDKYSLAPPFQSTTSGPDQK